MITRENLKQEIDTLSEDQFQVMADVLILLKNAQQTSHSKSFVWQRLTPIERANELRGWVNQLDKTDVSLSDEAFDRSSIYE